MTALIAHELRRASRRAHWPAAIGLHLAAVWLFVSAWGPTAGVPLWSASLLAQLAAADRLMLSVIVTWLAASIVIPRDGAGLAAWSVVTGQPIRAIALSRLVASGVLTTAIVFASSPGIAVAAQISSASIASSVWSLVELIAFGLLCVALTSAGTVIARTPLGVWSVSAAVGGMTAVGLREVPAGGVRTAVCLLAGLALALIGSGAAARREFWMPEPRS